MKLPLPAAAAVTGAAQAQILNLDASCRGLAFASGPVPAAGRAATSVEPGSRTLQLPPLKPGLAALGWRLRERRLT